MKLTDIVVTKFLEDTVVDDEIELANTKHNFFSQHVWNDTMLRVIDKKIRQEEDEIVSLKKLTNNLLWVGKVQPSKNLAGGLHWSELYLYHVPSSNI